MKSRKGKKESKFPVSLILTIYVLNSFSKKLIQATVVIDESSVFGTGGVVADDVRVTRRPEKFRTVLKYEQLSRVLSCLSRKLE